MELNRRELLMQWAEFNERKWGCRARLAEFEAPNSPARGEGLFFYNAKGKLYLPPLNPYHPFVFHSTPTDKPFKIDRQWREVAEAVAADMLKSPSSASFVFPTDITDIRPFLWSGFIADIKYTYVMELPYSLDRASADVRAKVRKAGAAGYRAARTEDMAEVHQCLAGTEARQGFTHRLGLEDLRLARSLLGPEAFRAYVCYAPSGEPVSASITICLDDQKAFGWIAASKTEHLNQGVVQLLQSFELGDLSDNGLKTFDFAGANIPSVASSKANWGGVITPYYLVRPPGYKEILRAGRNWLSFVRGRSRR